ncbi:MAG: hypothetical protein WBA89_26960 [Microcoleus sp.]
MTVLYCDIQGYISRSTISEFENAPTLKPVAGVHLKNVQPSQLIAQIQTTNAFFSPSKQLKIALAIEYTKLSFRRSDR